METVETTVLHGCFIILLRLLFLFPSASKIIMADNAAFTKEPKLDPFYQHHKGCEDLGFKPDPSSKYFHAGCQNQTCFWVPNSYSDYGESIPESQDSSQCRTQHSGLFNSASDNEIGKSNPLDVAEDTGSPLAGSVEHNLESISSDKVDETIELFRYVLSEIKQKYMATDTSFKPHIKAAMFLREEGNWLNAERRVGAVPGVGVYKEFLCRAELRVIGLHCQLEAGIDYMNVNGEIVATSIVDSGRYFIKTDTINKSLDSLIYHGVGGNPSVAKTKPKDQRLERGNRALYNSMRKKSPVRVIRKIKDSRSGSSQPSRFVYEGLYLVFSYRKVRGKYGKFVFEFSLRRQECGDEESMRSSGCDCTDGCSDSEDCSCKSENGGIIPYNYKECLVNPRPCIIECGPSCKCYESCLNRVSQRLRHLQHQRRGPMYELECFRSRLGIRGVRTRCFIPKGSFVCEYEGGIERLIRCSTYPNIIAQRVLYDHIDKSRPRVMLFAMEDIPCMKELTIGESLRRTTIISS